MRRGGCDEEEGRTHWRDTRDKANAIRSPMPELSSLVLNQLLVITGLAWSSITIGNSPGNVNYEDYENLTRIMNFAR